MALEQHTDWLLQSNTTSVMSGPSDKSSSVFAASRTGLVQLTTGGDLYGIAFSPDDDGANAQATWAKIATPKLTFEPNNLQQIAPSNSATASSTATSGKASDTASDSRARRTLLNGGLTVAGLGLGAIGLGLLV
jgi:septal ring-binding cell division protein DamX